MAHDPHCLCSECVSDPIEAVTRAIEEECNESDLIYDRTEDDESTAKREGNTVLVKSRGQWVRITVELA